jgi:hypothetical protein
MIRLAAIRLNLKTAVAAVLVAAVLLALVQPAWACPTCKDQLAHDPASLNLARGYALSILFMLSMPPLILGGLAAYFYWEVRRARARQASPPAIPLGSGS